MLLSRRGGSRTRNLQTQSQVRLPLHHRDRQSWAKQLASRPQPTNFPNVTFHTSICPTRSPLAVQTKPFRRDRTFSKCKSFVILSFEWNAQQKYERNNHMRGEDRQHSRWRITITTGERMEKGRRFTAYIALKTLTMDANTSDKHNQHCLADISP